MKIFSRTRRMMETRNYLRVMTLTLLGLLTLPATAQSSDEDVKPLAVVRIETAAPAPDWALSQRYLLELLNQAGEEFYDQYVLPDHTLEWQDRYQGGMNSSDDAYEAFRGFSLVTALGGSDTLDQLHRQVWEGITRQFTRYGQIYREFDSNWDWMHHGEGYVSLYPMGMVEPNDPVFRDRSIRFAAMFIGDDPEAPNWDPERKMMRAVMNGSRGPKMAWTKEDWTPTNSNLAQYHLPFQDIPGIDTPGAWLNDNPANDKFGVLVQAMSDRMAKGDVPINLTSVPLIANAYLYNGDPRYVQWVRDYLGTWVELTERNGGITPDNVGQSGEIGEYTGNWWGGYYGWVWPRGGMDVVYSTLTAAKVAVLLTGENHWAELPRSQVAVMRREGSVQDGIPHMMGRHDHRGWHYPIPVPSFPYVHLWFLTQDERDRREIDALVAARLEAFGRVDDPELEWARFVQGHDADFPERTLQRAIASVQRKLEGIRHEHGDPETWIDGKWLSAEPMMTDDLVRLSVGGLPVHKRGEMLHSQVRYFDGDRHRAGLPSDVAAMVSRIEADWIEVKAVNLHPLEARQLVVQGGAYGEHQFKSVSFGPYTEHESTTGEESPPSLPMSRELDAGAFVIELAPSAGVTLRIQLDRYTNQPSYQTPWNR